MPLLSCMYICMIASMLLLSYAQLSTMKNMENDKNLKNEAGIRVLVTFDIPEEAKYPCGLYYIDEISVAGKRAQSKKGVLQHFASSDQSEVFLDVLAPSKVLTESVSLHPYASYVIRSADMKNRFRVRFGQNKDDQERPYTIRIVNLALSDRDTTHPLELKHSYSGYEWIDPGAYAEHITG